MPKKPTIDEVLSLGKKIMKFPVLHKGWELDGEGFVYELPNKARYVVLTDHNRPYFPKDSELLEKMEEYEEAHTLTQLALEVSHGLNKGSELH